MTLTAKTGMNRNRRAVLSPWSYPGPGLPQPEHIGLFRLNGLISTSMQSPFLADTRCARVYVHPLIGWYRLSNVSMCMTRHLPFYVMAGFPGQRLVMHVLFGLTHLDWVQHESAACDGRPLF